MAILVTGATGAVGAQIVTELANRGAAVHALVREAGKARLPAGVTPVQADLTDPGSMRAALANVSTLFLLNAVVPDELTQALITLNLAREAGITRVVYFSVIHADKYTNVPHFTAKYTAERMIGQFDIPATILRPAYFMQNDLNQKNALLQQGIYPMPIGSTGAAMVDTRDIAEIAALHLIEREQSPTPLPRTTIDVVGPDTLTGPAIAGIWSETLGKNITYAGNDLAAFETQMAKFAPGWMAYDMRQMLGRIQQDGMIPNAGDTERLTALLGRPLRSYRDFAAEAARDWAAQ